MSCSMVSKAARGKEAKKSESLVMWVKVYVIYSVWDDREELFQQFIAMRTVSKDVVVVTEMLRLIDQI